MKSKLAAALSAAVFILAVSISGLAQGRVGTVQGTVKDPNGAVVSGARVTLTQLVTGYNQTVQSASDGAFKLVNVPFNVYQIKAEASGFEASQQSIDVESTLPLPVDFSLGVASETAVVNVSGGTAMVEPDKTSSDTDINQSIIERQPGASPSRGIEAIVASAPGFATDDNGRLHPRGSESQVQYVVDGIPITDNMSAI